MTHNPNNAAGFCRRRCCFRAKRGGGEKEFSCVCRRLWYTEGRKRNLIGPPEGKETTTATLFLYRAGGILAVGVGVLLFFLG